MTDNWREIFAEWRGGTAFIGQNKDNVQVQVGSTESEPGVSPMQMLLVALAGCSGSDIVDIMNKKRQPLTDFKIRVRGLRADATPAIFTEIHVEYLLWGENLEPKDVERAIELSEKKYCSVGAMLQGTAPIHSTYKILKPGETAQ